MGMAKTGGVLLTKPVTRLSQMGIDVDKDWAARRIKNIGAPFTDKDALPRGLVDIYSCDYGLKWKDLGTISFAWVICMAYLGNGIAILGDIIGHIYRSTDYGATWANLGVIANNYIYSMAYLGNGIAILGDWNGNVFRSTSAFQLWES